MQLRLALVALVLVPALARADDRVDSTVTWMTERKAEGGSLTVIHPQVDLGIDLGEHVSLSAGYEADVVSGATTRLYAAPGAGGVDVISTATTFDDLRHVGHGGLSLQGRRSRLFASYTYATERDYQSHSVTAGGSVDLPGKNTTFAVSYTHNFDQVCDKNNGDATPLERRPLSGEDPCFEGEVMRAPSELAPTVSRDVAIDTTEVSLTQNVSPTMVLQLGAHGQIIDGFQSNPYRAVRVGEAEAQERVPDERARLALFVRSNFAFPRAHSSLATSLRGYTDTWGVKSVAAEMAYHQYLGDRLVFRLRTRAYQQTKAVFFEDAIDYANFGSTGEYFTGDRELSPLRNVLVGGKLALLAVADDSGAVWGMFDEIDFHLRGDAMWADSLTDTAPGGDPGGVLPDVLVVSVGLLLRY